jgi:hypothetical protein
MGDFTVNVRQKPVDFNRWQLGLVISSSPPGKPQGQVTYFLHVQYIPRKRQKVHFFLPMRSMKVPKT